LLVALVAIIQIGRKRGATDNQHGAREVHG
jgi:hypothetical protein